MEVCSCDVTLGNTGKPGCKKAYLVTKYLLLTAILGSTGTANSFDVSAGEPQSADITAAINATDPKDRIYPIGEFEDITDERAEAIFQEFNSGKKVRVREGFREFIGFVPNCEPLVEGKIKKAGCSAIGAFMVDAAGNFVFSAQQEDGIINTAYPVHIDQDTLDVMYVKATDTTIAGLMIKFQWKSTEKDSWLRQVAASDLDWNGSILNGLIDVNGITANIVLDDTVDLTLIDDYGFPVEGLVAGDFALANLTTPGPVAIDSVTEIAEGVYTIDYTTAAVGAGQELEATITKTGFDFTKVKDDSTWTTV